MKNLIVVIVALMVVVVCGCASTTPHFAKMQPPTSEEVAMRELGLVDYVFLQTYDTQVGKFYADVSGDAGLRTVAGMRVGTVTVEKTEEGYQVAGSFSEVQYRNELVSVIREADSNDDHVITEEEVTMVLEKEYAKAVK